ncbi:toprim domain-containing protein [Mailhella sp.]
MDIISVYEQSGRTLKRKTNNEFSGSCPVCGGTDRLLLWKISRDEQRFPRGNFYCRQCRSSGGPERLTYLLQTSSAAEVSAVHQARQVGSSAARRTVSRMQAVPSAITDAGYQAIVAQAQALLNSGARNGLARYFLQTRGIELSAAVRHRLGYIDKGIKYEPLQPKPFEPRLPVGLLIPNYREGTLRSIKVRAMDGDADNNSGYHAKYRELIGCPAMPYVIKASPRQNTPVLIVESELDAILIEQFMGSMFNYIALGSASALPDTEVAAMVESSGRVIFLPDYDEAGYGAYERWKRQFPKIELAELPRGKDPGEALKAGVDLKAWAMALRLSHSSCQR